MSDNKKNEDKSDITRIEDLSEYLHDEDEVIEGLDSFSGMDDAELMDAKTDPNIELPPEFTQTIQDPEETNFEQLESEDSFDSFNAPPELPEENSENEEDNAFSEDSFDPEDGPTSFDEPDFDSPSEENAENAYESNDFETNDFESNDFETNDFETNDFESNDFDSDENASNDFEFDNKDNEETEVKVDSEDSFENDEDDFDSLSDESYESPIEENKTEEVVSSPMATEPVEAEQVKLKTPIVNEVAPSYKPSENFNELQKFAKNITYGNLASEGTPPFSIILKDIKYQEDIDDIIALLREFKIINSDEEADNARKSLVRGNMLIPRLGEFAAITICHKLRRYDLNILMGLTEEINPPKEYDSDDSGVVSKHTVYNSRSHHYNLDKEVIDASDILVSTTPYLEGHDIIEYLGIASENTVIDTQLLQRSHELEEELIGRLPNFQQDKQRLKQIERENALAAGSSHPESILEEDANPKNNHQNITLKDIHIDLVAKLKNQAAEQKGNAIIGVTFHVSPLTKNPVLDTRDQYQVTCSGSVVWINKR